jgi:PAS domain S-box-containing protein
LTDSVTDLGGLGVGAEDFLAAVLRTIAQPVWVVDPEGLIRFANPAAVAALGYDNPDELIGRNSHNTIHYRHPDGRPYPASECPMLLPRTSGATIARDLDWFFRRDGSIFPVSYVSVPIEMSRGRGAVVAFNDIESRLRAEEELRERDVRLAEEQSSLRRLAALVAGGADSVEVFAAVAREVAHVLSLPLVEMSRYEPDGTTTVIGVWSQPGHSFQNGTPWRLAARTLATLVLRTASPTRIDDSAGLADGIAEAARDTDIRCGAGAPIIVDGKVWGVMTTGSVEPEPLPPDIEARLAGFTELVATAISTTQARQDLRRLADEQAALRRVATLVAHGATPEKVLRRSRGRWRKPWLNEAAAVLGGRSVVAAMVQTALTPTSETATITDARWVAQTADDILAVMEESRSTWQMWHVRAEAQRQVRTADLPSEPAGALVDLLVDEVLDGRSVALAAPLDDIDHPQALRRTNGSSVYTVAGADLYTSQRILDAERRLVAAAGRRDGAVVDESGVDLALLEMAANGTALDAGQASLVRQMCTSGARVQLAIAPAGAGKTTAMRALTLAWTQDRSQVIGLAPSAAAAAVLGEQTGIGADTLAKLTWSLQHGDLPDWAAAVGPSTLVIIDEAGMANTLSLDRAVQFAVDRGASVRLIGDDQQLAAIGAGGVLRDIKQTHGVLHLTELHRFTNPAEAAATLALRDGDPAALDFHLRHDRVHVGDLAKTTEDAFHAWVSDLASGLDAIMLAPTRELVAELNRRARDHRLDHTPASSDVGLADGNQASVGDVIITRANDRRLRLTATDWVKNGDRWTITCIGRRGDLTVRHNRSQLIVRLPSAYVRTSTGLGYATTIHTAQGVSADTMHGLLTGQESRQQLYTMLTRGQHANHLYLQVVGDGDPHNLIRPDTISPHTPTETLQQIIDRDEAPASASTLLRELNDPAARLFQAVQRYTDGLHVAAEQLLGPQTVAELDEADQYVPGLTTEPAWPTLRAQLLALAAETGQHPLRHLLTAATGRDLETAGDMAAVLDWRLPALTPIDPGPLPWLPGIPGTLHSHPVWGAYLAKRSQLVFDLADQVEDHACQGDAEPVWAAPGSYPSTALVGEIAVWRAANGINPQDPRPTGGTQLETLPALWKQHLDRHIARATDPAGNARSDERQAAHTAPSHRHDDSRRRYQKPGQRPNGPAAPGR